MPEQGWHYLLSDHVGSLGGVVALADGVADLLAVHDEVDAVGGQHQEAVVSVVQLQQRHTGCTTLGECCWARELPPSFYTLAKHFFSEGVACSLAKFFLKLRFQGRHDSTAVISLNP